MGKQLYKVELTGWVVANDEDSNIMNWPIDTITKSLVGLEIQQATLIDSSNTPITFNTLDVSPPFTAKEVYAPTVHFTTDTAMHETGAMDIELDTKGMSL